MSLCLTYTFIRVRCFVSLSSLFLDVFGLTENRGAKKKASTSPKTWAMPKSWEKPRLHLFSFKDLQDPSLGRLFLPSYQLEPRGGVLHSSRPTYLIACYNVNQKISTFAQLNTLLLPYDIRISFLFFLFFVFFYFYIFLGFLFYVFVLKEKEKIKMLYSSTFGGASWI